MAGNIELPLPLDLRFQTPPLGYRPEEVPPLDIADVNLAAHRILKPDGSPSNVFVIPDQPDYLLREHLINDPTTTTSALKKLVEAGNSSFAWFENEGIQVPSHRHIGGELARINAAGNPIEGYLLTICKRLPNSYKTLDPTNRDHIPGSLSVLRTAHKYLDMKVNDPTVSDDILDDCLSADQFSVDLQTGRIALHDTSLYVEDIKQRAEAGEEWMVKRCVGTLDHFAAAVVEGARGTSFAAAALAIREQIRVGLPNPDYSNEYYAPPTLEEQLKSLGS